MVNPLLRALRFPLTLIPPQTRVPILFGPLAGARWIVGSGNHVVWIGLYEYRKQVAFKRALNQGAVVFDLGAHAGLYTLLASRLVGPRGVVVAFEPLPRNIAYLKDHLRLNRAANVRVIAAAVSDQDESLEFTETC